MAKEAGDIDHGSGSGALCLDFANTVDWHASNHPTDTLRGYADLVEWSRRRGILNFSEAKSLLTAFGNQKELGDVVMDEAGELREAVYRLFSDKWRGESVREEDLNTINSQLSKGMSMARLALQDGSFRWGWKCDEHTPDMMLWPIARNAAELLTSKQLKWVKQCANEEEGCGWLFLDTSRSGNRVWCSMESCGNRAKFRAFYARQKVKGRRARPRQPGGTGG